MPDVAQVRDRLEEHLAANPPGAMVQIARAVGLNPSTVSRFRRGTYQGNMDEVARLLAQTLNNSRAAELLASGDARVNWIVITEQGLKLARMARTRDALMAKHPGALVLTVILGPTPSDAVILGSDVVGALEQSFDGGK